jgi:hypothetical protein
LCGRGRVGRGGGTAAQGSGQQRAGACALEEICRQVLSPDGFFRRIVRIASARFNYEI